MRLLMSGEKRVQPLWKYYVCHCCRCVIVWKSQRVCV